MSGALGIQLPDLEFDRIVEDSLDWFYDNYGDSVEHKLLIIEHDKYISQYFKDNRAIILPDCIFSIWNLKEIKGNSPTLLGISDGDITFEKSLGVGGYMTDTGNMSDADVYNIVSMSYQDLSQVHNLTDIRYDYNRNTNRLNINGRVPNGDTSAEVYVKIPNESLYNDNLFRKYVTGMSRVSLGNMLGMFEFSLPGGASFNADRFITQGEQEIEQVIEKIDEENVPSAIFLTH